jgi:hypothetical protein
MKKKKRPLKRRAGRGRPANDYTPSRKRDLPTDEFCDWWNPSGIDELSGAAIGGHPDAKRIHARKDPGRWTRRTYGTTANIAWQCETYREEFRRWLDAGKPEREKYVSIVLPLDKQHVGLQGIQSILKKAGLSAFGPPEE